MGWFWIMGEQVNVKMPAKDVDKAVDIAAKVSGEEPGTLKAFQKKDNGKYAENWHTEEVL